jgi:hypothetical protein
MRRAFVVALLLAFVLQAQLAASHFHLTGSNVAATSADSGKSGPAKSQKKTPAEDDCPICQQLASAHSFLLQPATAISLPELVAAQAFVVHDQRAHVPLIALGWQSRAPPL